LSRRGSAPRGLLPPLRGGVVSQAPPRSARLYPVWISRRSRRISLRRVTVSPRATASKIPVILAVLDGNLVCSYNVYYWHIFNNHPNYGCKSLEYSQNFRSITVSGLPCLMKNPHFDAVALIETALRISRLSHPGHGTRCTGWWLRHRSRRFSAAHPQTRNPQG